MARDITYCFAFDCPFAECERNVNNLRGETGVYISIADLRGVCRSYIRNTVLGLEELNGDKDYFDPT